MKILDVDTWYELFKLNFQKGKKTTGIFGMYFSCLGPFWVWGETCMNSSVFNVTC